MEVLGFLLVVKHMTFRSVGATTLMKEISPTTIDGIFGNWYEAGIEDTCLLADLMPMFCILLNNESLTKLQEVRMDSGFIEIHQLSLHDYIILVFNQLHKTIAYYQSVMLKILHTLSTRK